MDMVADTNVWYDLAEGRLDPAGLKATGRLFATPTNFLELASKLTSRNLVQRQRAARAVVNHGDGVLCDTETRLMQIWGVPRTFDAAIWWQGFNALANASDLAALRAGVPNVGAGVVGTVDFRLAHKWRMRHWDAFRRDVEDAVEVDVPGYKKARARGRNKHMSGAARPAFERKVGSTGFQTSLLLATYSRALLAASLPPSPPEPAAVANAQRLLTPYLAVYAQYLIGCACEFAPAANDLGDLECFVYLESGTHLLTAEKRWKRLAKKAGIDHLLVKT
jgi:hypothetical protein